MQHCLFERLELHRRHIELKLTAVDENRMWLQPAVGLHFLLIKLKCVCAVEHELIDSSCFNLLTSTFPFELMISQGSLVVVFHHEDETVAGQEVLQHLHEAIL